MSEEKNNNLSATYKSYFILVVGILIALFRILIFDWNNQQLLLVMALINYISFIFVLYVFFEEIFHTCKKHILAAGITTKKRKTQNHILSFLCFVLISIFLIIGVLYISFYRTNTLNDAISIIALMFSMAANGLTTIVGNKVYRFIIFLTKK